MSGREGMDWFPSLEEHREVSIQNGQELLLCLQHCVPISNIGEMCLHINFHSQDSKLCEDRGCIVVSLFSQNIAYSH